VFGLLSLTNYVLFILYTDILTVILNLRLCLACFLCLYNLDLLVVLLSVFVCFALHFCVNKDYHYWAKNCLPCKRIIGLW